MPRGAELQCVFLKFSRPSVQVRNFSRYSTVRNHYTFYRKIHLCKIKCHRYNKTENFDFSIFPALR